MSLAIQRTKQLGPPAFRAGSRRGQRPFPTAEAPAVRKNPARTMVQNLRLHQRELEVQNAELRRIQLELEDSAL